MSSEQQSQSQKQEQQQSSNKNNSNNISSDKKPVSILERISDLKPIRFNGAQTIGIGTLPSVPYGLFYEKVRQNASNGFNCSIFCDGKRCKFEGPACWTSDDMAINGIYSCWVTDDIVTMARPSTVTIEKYKIIKQFKEHGIRSLINLQQRGEHANCGIALEKSGFSYDPQIFMENMIFYYNFGWKENGPMSKTMLLDMVKVLSFALSEGKVAIHSHCGLGRAAVLVACYLVYSLRCKPNDAVAYLRAKRPDMIKTKNQIQSIQAFAQFVVPMFIVYANVIPRDYRSSHNQYLKRQRYLLHGFEARLLKHIPKPVFMFCEKLLSLLEDHTFLDSSNPDLGADETCQDFIGDPNRFLGFFSAGYKLDLHFPSKFTSKKQFALLLEGQQNQNHVPGKVNHVMANGLDDSRYCAPPSPTRVLPINKKDELSAFPESPASSSSPDGSSNRRTLSNPTMGGQYFKLQEEDDFLNLSDDEETGLNPEIEFNNNSHPNSVPLSHSRRSSKADIHENDKTIIIDNHPIIIQNGGIGIIPHKINGKDELDSPAIVEPYDDSNENEDIDVLEEVAVVDCPVEEEDPLEDMNSEEVNDIIDSVLEESPSEEEILESAKRTKSHKRNNNLMNNITTTRDIKTSKNGKGCSVVEEGGDEENNEKPPKTTYTNAEIIDALLADHYVMDGEFLKTVRRYQRAINYRSSSWDRVANEWDPLILSALLWSWLDQLKEPVLNVRDLSCIVIRAERPIEILHKLDMDTRYTTEYLVRFIAQLHPKSTTVKEDLLKRLLASLTHQTLGIRGTLRPVGQEDWNKMRQGTTRALMTFLQRLYDLVLHDQEQIPSPIL